MRLSFKSELDPFLLIRFPKSLSYVILDMLEKTYLAGFVPLQLFIVSFPVFMVYRRQQLPSVPVDCVPPCAENETISSAVVPTAMEFLPLMLTSVYCAVGVVWGFFRLLFVYLREDTTYQGQLSAIQ